MEILPKVVDGIYVDDKPALIDLKLQPNKRALDNKGETSKLTILFRNDRIPIWIR